METNSTKNASIEAMPYPVKFRRIYKLLYSYERLFKSPFKIEKRNNAGQVVGIETLKGFSFKREDIERILYKDIKNHTPSDAKFVHIAFGHHYGETHPEDASIKNMNDPTLIAFGLKEDYVPIIGSNVAFDYCDPCPKKCPKWEDDSLLVKQSVAYAEFDINPPKPEADDDTY